MKSLKKTTRPAAQARKREPVRLPNALPPLDLPPGIRRPLRAVAGKQLCVAWTQCLLWIICTVCVLLLAQTGADFLLDLPWRTRLGLLVGDGLLLCGLIFRYGFMPWRKRLTLEQAALRAERHFPLFRSSLISAVQLARRPEGSSSLVAALLGQVTKRVSEVNLRRVIPAAHLLRLAFWAMVLMAVTGGSIRGFAPKSYLLLQRLCLFNVPLPTDTIVVPVSGDLAIPAGETIELAAKATGVIPRTGRIEIFFEGKPMQVISINPKPTTPELFSVRLQNVQQPLRYRFCLNDGHSPDFQVKLLHGPVLETVAFKQTYPAYTGLKPTEHSAGNLTLMAGSKLHIEGRASQPLQTAQIQLQKEGKSVEMKIGSDPKLAACEIAIPAKGLEGFSILLENTDGMKSQGNAFYRVEVIPDKPPEVVFSPGQPESASLVASAQPRLRFEVRDDFKVKQVFFCCQLAVNTPDGAAAPDVPAVKKIPLSVPKPAGILAFDYQWKSPSEFQGWKEGAIVNHWIEAVDDNDVTGPGVGRSPTRQWNVVSVEAKREELNAKLRKQAESLDDLSRTQEMLRKNVGDFLKYKGAR